MSEVKFFDERSSRMIAACRLALAVTFELSVLLDPHESTRDTFSALVFLVGYIVFAVEMVPIAWRYWWIEHRLGPITFVIDGMAFLAAAYFTESADTELASPFLAFFTFLMLTATVRWSWRATLAAAVLLSLGYVVVGLTLDAQGVEINFYHLGQRTVYMAVLSFLLIWFVLRGRRTVASRILPVVAEDDILKDSLRAAVSTLKASGGAICWSGEDEPRTELRTVGTLGEREESIPPQDFTIPERLLPTLFDRQAKRVLERTAEGAIVSHSNRFPPGLAGYLQLDEGISLPLEGETGRGQLVLCGIDGMSRDEFDAGAAVSSELTSAIDRTRYDSVTRDAELMRMRGALARDLHDSVAQSLAGAIFRLESLRRKIERDEDPRPEIDSIREGLKAEQTHVRSLIEQLRLGQRQPGLRDISTDLRGLSESLAQQWQVSVRPARDMPPIMVPATLAYEVQQIVREGIANAVRHGQASRVGIELSAAKGGLQLQISDNGTGFPASQPPATPRSIAERVAALGGTLAITSSPGDTQLNIELIQA